MKLIILLSPLIIKIKIDKITLRIYIFIHFNIIYYLINLRFNKNGSK